MVALWAQALVLTVSLQMGLNSSVYGQGIQELAQQKMNFTTSMLWLRVRVTPNVRTGTPNSTLFFHQKTQRLRSAVINFLIVTTAILRYFRWLLNLAVL